MIIKIGGGGDLRGWVKKLGVGGSESELAHPVSKSSRATGSLGVPVLVLVESGNVLSSTSNF